MRTQELMFETETTSIDDTTVVEVVLAGESIYRKNYTTDADISVDTLTEKTEVEFGKILAEIVKTHLQK